MRRFIKSDILQDATDEQLVKIKVAGQKIHSFLKIYTTSRMIQLLYLKRMEMEISMLLTTRFLLLLYHLQRA